MTQSKAECSQRSPGRPRSKQSREAIIQATLDLLEEQSLGEISIEAIARRAKVGKATIYKWWQSKAHLVLEVFLESKYRNAPIPNTGSTKQDLLKHINALTHFHQTRPGQALVHFLAEGQTDPDFQKDLWDRFLTIRRKAMSEMLARGVKRGELRDDIDIDLMIDLIYAPMIYRQMIGFDPMDERTVSSYVTSLMEGLGTR
ncbi:TetR/AcrR family transcriptional regulator [Pseudodesulfovibrio sp.]|uniref:TetR/AcrR family transcriptional regulator n=1 Tax=unclassified Pseudodesulfovibrio TaxID=2661612 RepID=UPI003B0074DF